MWFGTNGCGGAALEYDPTGWGFMAQTPQWTLKKDSNGKYVYWTDLKPSVERNTPYIPSDPKDPHYESSKYLFEMENKAVRAMFDHLAQVDTTHQTILFQVNNEVDGAKNFFKNNETWKKLCNELAGQVKESDYVVATRMNFHRGYWANGMKDNTGQHKALAEYGSLENIDIIGPDSYDRNLVNQRNYAVDAGKYTRSGIGQIPESSGNSNNKSGLYAVVLQSGNSVSSWHLNNSHAANASFSFYGEPKDGYEWYYQWVLGTIPEMPVSAQRATNFNISINKMNELISSLNTTDMAEFNSGIESRGQKDPDKQYTGTKKLGGRDVTFTTDSGSVAYAAYDPKTQSTYVMSDALVDSGDSVFNLGKGMKATVGYFDKEGSWVETDRRDVAGNGDIVVKPTELVRVSTAPTDGINRDALEDAINAAGKYTEGAYTASTWNALSKALSEAKTVYDAKDSTQAQVDAQTQSLNAAIDSLEQKKAKGIAVTTTPTKTIYKVGERFDPKRLAITATWNDGTSTLLSETEYSLSGFDSKTIGKKTITVALKGSDPLVTTTFAVHVKNEDGSMADKGDLQSLLAQAAQLEQIIDSYPEELRQPFLDAVRKAGAVNDKVNATQDEVDEALKQLQIAINTLLDYSDPVDGITITSAPTKSTYKIGEELDPAGLAVMATRKSGEQSPLYAEEYTLSGFDSSAAGKVAVVVSLNANPAKTASFTVTVIADETPVRRDKLQDAIDAATRLNESDYTQQSWSVLDQALRKARTVLADSDASQEEVDAAADALNDAISALVKIKDEGTPSKPSDPGSGDGQTKPGNDQTKPGADQNKPGNDQAGSLEKTGSSVVPMAVAGMLLAAVAVALYEVSRRTRRP
ncbi:hypothetical protein GFD25_07320 [Bifidobacterium aerophilum]|uniref:Ig-like domain-containing protein n=1 Tax=Bifidobacterium aerophilum TaxID=1798155 RepID=A0A6N9Z581_9BIFI|nr:hypothetical protein [Bifidobacterium aerophilum]